MASIVSGTRHPPAEAAPTVAKARSGGRCSLARKMMRHKSKEEEEAGVQSASAPAAKGRASLMSEIKIGMLPKLRKANQRDYASAGQATTFPKTLLDRTRDELRDAEGTAAAGDVTRERLRKFFEREFHAYSTGEALPAQQVECVKNCKAALDLVLKTEVAGLGAMAARLVRTLPPPSAAERCTMRKYYGRALCLAAAKHERADACAWLVCEAPVPWIAVVEVLVERGGRAILGARDDEKRTPLMHACRTGATDTVEYLWRQSGVETRHARCRREQHCLMYACQHEQAPQSLAFVLARVAEEGGASQHVLAAQDEQQRTPLIHWLQTSSDDAPWVEAAHPLLCDAASLRITLANLNAADDFEAEAARYTMALTLHGLLMGGDGLAEMAARDYGGRAGGGSARRAGAGAAEERVGVAADAFALLMSAARVASTSAAAAEQNAPAASEQMRQLVERLQVATAAMLKVAREDQFARERGISDRFASQQLFRCTFSDALLNSETGRDALALALDVKASTLLRLQPELRMWIMRTWRGGHAQLRRELLSREFVPSLIAQLVLLLVAALYPPAWRWWRRLERQLHLGRATSDDLPPLLGTPAAKFWVAASFELALAIVVTIVPSSMLAAPAGTAAHILAPSLIAWVGCALVWEVKQMVTEGIDRYTGTVAVWWELRKVAKASLLGYLSDPINLIDGLSLSLTLAGLLAAYTDPRERDGYAYAGQFGSIALAVGSLLLWLRFLRVLLVTHTFGGFILMVLHMLVADVMRYLVLLLVFVFAYTAAVTKMFEPPGVGQPGVLSATGGIFSQFDPPLEWVANNHGTFPSCDVQFASWPRAWQLLWDGAFRQEGYFDCVGVSTKPVQGMVLMYTYHTIVSLLLLNMLIAMMSKTYDAISTEAETNYNLRFAQTALSYDKLPVAPPPLYVLSLPWEAYEAVRWLVTEASRLRNARRADGIDAGEAGSTQSCGSSLPESSRAAASPGGSSEWNVSGELSGASGGTDKTRRREVFQLRTRLIQREIERLSPDDGSRVRASHERLHADVREMRAQINELHALLAGPGTGGNVGEPNESAAPPAKSAGSFEHGAVSRADSSDWPAKMRQSSVRFAFEPPAVSLGARQMSGGI